MDQIAKTLEAQMQSPESMTAKANEWIKCLECKQEYSPRVIVEGLCDLCTRIRERAAEESRRRESRMIVSLGGEKAFREFTEDRFSVTDDNRKAFEAVKAFDPERHNLYLWGPCGVGKTFLACLAARRALEAGQRASFIKPFAFLQSIRGKTGDEERARIWELVQLPLLIVDELGFDNDTQYARLVLYEIIDGRDMSYRQGLIVTSNLSPAQLADKTGDDRLPSRLSGLCRVIEVKGQDWRKGKGRERWQ